MVTHEFILIHELKWYTMDRYKKIDCYVVTYERVTYLTVLDI